MEGEYELIDGYLRRQSPEVVARLVRSRFDAADERRRSDVKSAPTAAPVELDPKSEGVVPSAEHQRGGGKRRVVRTLPVAELDVAIEAVRAASEAPSIATILQWMDWLHFATSGVFAWIERHKATRPTDDEFGDGYFAVDLACGGGGGDRPLGRIEHVLRLAEPQQRAQMLASWDGDRLNVNLQTAHATALQMLVCLWWRVVPPCVCAEKTGARDVSEVVLSFDGIPGRDGEIADGVSKPARVAFLKYGIGEDRCRDFAECLLNRIDWIRHQLPRLEWDVERAQHLLDRMQSERASVEHALRSSPPGTWDYLFAPRWPWTDDDSQTPLPADEPPADPKRTQSPDGYLGLVIDDRERTVSRPAKSLIPARLSESQLHVVIAMVRAGTYGITRDRALVEAGTAKSGLREFKRELNARLSVVSVQIEPRTWKIVEADETSA